MSYQCNTTLYTNKLLMSLNLGLLSKIISLSDHRGRFRDIQRNTHWVHSMHL